MILRGSGHKYDGSWRMVLYEADGAGKCSPKLAKSYLDEEIQVYHEQRQRELVRLHRALFAGEISPIGFFAGLQRVDLRYLASCVRLRPAQVRSHLTPAGFERIDVRTLRRYARVFDIAVADFFAFTELADGLGAQTEHAQDRLVEQIKVFVGPA
ncbi:MAG: hypothetical protein HY744_34705 [Deltaproteobacteria bacterium]|nr:hypothetical protein [Deltaproteobacteria bacterium]